MLSRLMGATFARRDFMVSASPPHRRCFIPLPSAPEFRRLLTEVDHLFFLFFSNLFEFCRTAARITNIGNHNIRPFQHQPIASIYGKFAWNRLRSCRIQRIGGIGQSFLFPPLNNKTPHKSRCFRRCLTTWLGSCGVPSKKDAADLSIDGKCRTCHKPKVTTLPFHSYPLKQGRGQA